jgi:hypothetical protein
MRLSFVKTGCKNLRAPKWVRTNHGGGGRLEVDSAPRVGACDRAYLVRLVSCGLSIPNLISVWT